MRQLKTITILIFGTLLLGVLNVMYHWSTDWILGIYIGKLFGVDLSVELYKHYNFVIFNSLYSGPRLGNITLLQTLLVMLFSGYFGTTLILNKVRKQKVSWFTLFMTLIFWVVKIPVTVENSNFYGLYLGGLAL